MRILRGAGFFGPLLILVLGISCALSPKIDAQQQAGSRHGKKRICTEWRFVEAIGDSKQPAIRVTLINETGTELMLCQPIEFAARISRNDGGGRRTGLSLLPLTCGLPAPAEIFADRERKEFILTRQFSLLPGDEKIEEIQSTLVTCVPPTCEPVRYFAYSCDESDREAEMEENQ